MNTVQISRFNELEQIIEKGLRTFIDVGRCFVEIKESGLYKEKYKTFEAYCDQRWGFSLNYAERLMRTVRTEDTLKKSMPMGTELPTNERQAREIDGLTDEQKQEAWSESIKTAPGGVVTGAHVRATRERLFPSSTKEETMQKGVLIKCPECGHEWFIDN